MLKKIIATILTVALFVTGMSVTSFAANTKDYGYTIVNSTKRINLISSDPLTGRSDAGDDTFRYLYEYALLRTSAKAPTGHIANGVVYNIYKTGYALVKSNKNAKCYFKNSTEKRWHLYKNYVKISKPGTYKVKYVWSDENGKRSDIVEFIVHKWAPVEIVYDGYLADAKSITLNIATNETPTTAKFYYTTDGSKPTTKSKEYKPDFDLVHTNKLTFKKTCTFRMLITCPDYEDTYLSVPIGIGKEYTANFNHDRLDDGAYCTALTGVFQQAQEVEFFKGYDETYKFYYTLDGSKPTTKSATVKYRCEYITIDKSCTLRVLVIDANGKKTYGAFRYVIDNTQSQDNLIDIW